MKTTAKPDATYGGLFKVAVVGATSLLGKELKDVLSERNFPSLEVSLLDDEEAQGQLESVGDEATFIQSLVPENLEGVDFTFFASDPAYTKNTWEVARDKGSDVIDLSYALENQAELRAPWVDRELGREHRELAPAPVVIAHPAAVVLAMLMLRLRKVSKISRANVTVFEPASERGRRGMDELHDQTVNLLSFQQQPTEVYGTQIAFNLTSGYGESAKPTLASIEERIARHYKTVVGEAVDLPSLMLLQAPVFHGYTFSMYIELADALSVGDVEAALGGEHVQIMRGAERPNNVNIAGLSDIQVAVRADSVCEKGLWLWAASDNLRVLASNAVEAAEAMSAMRPRGKVQ